MLSSTRRAEADGQLEVNHDLLSHLFLRTASHVLTDLDLAGHASARGPTTDNHATRFFEFAAPARRGKNLEWQRRTAFGLHFTEAFESQLFVRLRIRHRMFAVCLVRPLTDIV